MCRPAVRVRQQVESKVDRDHEGSFRPADALGCRMAINTGLIGRWVNGGICVVYDTRTGRRMDHREALIGDAKSDNKNGSLARE